jgi:ankyrin repeat protein
MLGDNQALQLASRNGHLEVVKLLHENGADLHAQDDWALQLASLNGNLKVVELLKSRMM